MVEGINNVSERGGLSNSSCTRRRGPREGRLPGKGELRNRK